MMSRILNSFGYLMHELGKRYVWKRGKRYTVMGKLDPVQVRYIVWEKNKGRSTKEIAVEMKVCERRVPQIYREYSKTGCISVLGRPGRPRRTVTRQTAQDVL